MAAERSLPQKFDWTKDLRTTDFQSLWVYPRLREKSTDPLPKSCLNLGYHLSCSIMWSSWIRARCSRSHANPPQKKDPGEEPSTRQLELTDWAQTPLCVQLSLAHPQYWPVKYTTSSPWSKQNKSGTEGAKSQTQSITAISHVKHVRAPQKRTRLTNRHQPCSSCTVCTHVQKGIKKKKKKISWLPQTLHSPGKPPRGSWVSFKDYSQELFTHHVNVVQTLKLEI